MVVVVLPNFDDSQLNETAFYGDDPHMEIDERNVSFPTVPVSSQLERY